jgi:hypothetical protein
MTSLPRRRALLALLGTTALIACQSGTTPTVTPAGVISDVQAVVNGLAGALSSPAVTAAINAVPAAAAILPVIQKDVALAQGALATLASNTSAAQGASIVSQINGWLNAIIDTADAPPLIGLIPSPFNLAITAAAVLLPGLETFVDQYLPTTATAAAVAHKAGALRGATTMTPDAARALLAKFAG